MQMRGFGYTLIFFIIMMIIHYYGKYKSKAGDDNERKS